MKNIVVEFKYRRVTRPMLDQIVGTALRNNLTPPSDIIIKCRSATQTAYTAIKEYELNRQIIIHIDDCLEEYSRDGE